MVIIPAVIKTGKVNSKNTELYVYKLKIEVVAAIAADNIQLNTKAVL